MSLTTTQQNQVNAIVAQQQSPSYQNAAAIRAVPTAQADLDSLLGLAAITHDQYYMARRVINLTE